MTTGDSTGRGVIAGNGHRVVDAQRHVPVDDFGFGQIDQRGVDRQRLSPARSALGGQIGHRLEGGDVFRSAVGVAAVVECVDADEDVGASRSFRPDARASDKKTVLRAGT